jgi:hypothetical protein
VSKKIEFSNRSAVPMAKVKTASTMVLINTIDLLSNNPTKTIPTNPAANCIEFIITGVMLAKGDFSSRITCPA